MYCDENTENEKEEQNIGSTRPHRNDEVRRKRANQNKRRVL